MHVARPSKFLDSFLGPQARLKLKKRTLHNIAGSTKKASKQVRKIVALRRAGRGVGRQRQVMLCRPGPPVEGQLLNEDTSAAAEEALKDIRGDPIRVVGEGSKKGVVVAFDMRSPARTGPLAREQRAR